MQYSSIIGLVISGVLLLYIGVVIGILYLVLSPYIESNEFVNPYYTKNIILPPKYDNKTDNTIKYGNVPLQYSDRNYIPPELDQNNNKIVIKNKNKNKKKNLNHYEFSRLYCSSELEQMRDELNTDRDLYISCYYAKDLPVQHALQNINFALMKKSDIVFISGLNYKNESKVIRYNDNIPVNYPRINIDNSNLEAYVEVPGYFSYSTYISSDNSQIFIGVNSDSIFIQDPNSKSEIYDSKCDNDGYMSFINVRITSGELLSKKLRIVHIYKNFNVTDKYNSLVGFNVVKYLLSIINMLYNEKDGSIIIIGGYFGIRNELIQLALKKSNLCDCMTLFPRSDIVTANDYNGCSNPDAVILDNRLIELCDYVKVSTFSPWVYDNNHNYILCIILKNFKDKNYDYSKEIARSNWSRNHAQENYTYPPIYNIPIEFNSDTVDDLHEKINTCKIIRS